MTTLGTTPSEPARRVSHEAAVLDILTESLADIPGAIFIRGQGRDNRFGIDGWALSPLQLFQFGDLRIELPSATLVVEAESAGGVGNLAKYWPLLRSGALQKRMVLAHLFMLGSDGDYIAHRKLWEFLVECMTHDLQQVGVVRAEHWDARLFTYRRGEPLDDLQVFLRAEASTAS